MKIAIFWQQQQWGGVDTHLLSLLENWPSSVDNFILFYNRNNTGYPRIASALNQLTYVTSVPYRMVTDFGFLDKLPVINNLLKILRYGGRPYFFWKMMRQSRKLFKKHGPFDVLLSTNGGYPAAWGCLAAILSAKQAKIPKRMLLVHHAAVKPVLFFGAFEHFVDRMISKKATDLIAVSLATRKSLLDYRWFDPEMNPIRVVYNGVELERPVEKAVLPFNLRKAFALKDEILIGVVGRIERYKGHEDLILGFSLLPDALKNKARLIFIGKGEEKEIQRLKNIAHYLDISQSLIFTGYIEASARVFIAQLDLLTVMTKDFEGFGLTIGEAMSVNTPVLATRVGAIPEFVNDDVGTLVAPESPYEVSEKLKAFIENPLSFVDKTERARQHIQKFSSTRMAKHFHMLCSLK